MVPVLGAGQNHLGFFVIAFALIVVVPEVLADRRAGKANGYGTG